MGGFFFFFFRYFALFSPIMQEKESTLRKYVSSSS